MSLTVIYDAGQEPGSSLGRRQEEHQVALQRHSIAMLCLKTARECEQEARKMVALTAQALRGGR